MKPMRSPCRRAFWVTRCARFITRFDIRASKAINLGSRRRVELIGQVFNLFGRTNLGGIGSSFNTNALSNTFSQLSTAQPRQQGEVAVRVTF